MRDWSAFSFLMKIIHMHVYHYDVTGNGKRTHTDQLVWARTHTTYVVDNIWMGESLEKSRKKTATTTKATATATAAAAESSWIELNPCSGSLYSTLCTLVHVGAGVGSHRCHYICLHVREMRFHWFDAHGMALTKDQAHAYGITSPAHRANTPDHRIIWHFASLSLYQSLATSVYRWKFCAATKRYRNQRTKPARNAELWFPWIHRVHYICGVCAGHCFSFHSRRIQSRVASFQYYKIQHMRKMLKISLRYRVRERICVSAVRICVHVCVSIVWVRENVKHTLDQICHSLWHCNILMEWNAQNKKTTAIERSQ